jgi:hypothetical protein
MEVSPPVGRANLNASIGHDLERSYLCMLVDNIIGPFREDIIILNKDIIIENGIHLSANLSSLRAAA